MRQVKMIALHLRVTAFCANDRFMKLLASLLLASVMFIYPASARGVNEPPVIRIVKGKTTAGEILRMLGTPYSANAVAVRGSKHGERCLYAYDTVSVQRIWYPAATAGLFLPPSLTFRYRFPNTITTKHHRKATIIFDSDKIVVNYWIKERHM